MQNETFTMYKYKKKINYVKNELQQVKVYLAHSE